MLELQECLKGSCVPEEWQWQKWVSPNLQIKPDLRFGTKVLNVSLVPDGGYPINREDGWKPVHWAER